MTRRILVARGRPAETLAQARAWVAALDPDDVCFTGPNHDLGCLLGRGFTAVVLDLHRGLDADRLAMAQGFVRGGGALILRLPPATEVPDHPALAAWPFGPRDVGRGMWDRVVGGLNLNDGAPSDVFPTMQATHAPPGQEDVAQSVAAILRGAHPARFAVLTADRGRGKSAALGLALHALASSGLRIAVTGPGPMAVREVLRFAGGGVFVPAWRIGGPLDAVLVDEAAQLPLPVLQALVSRLQGTRFAFATTVGGYEGTGRGFALRFVDWLRSSGKVHEMTLSVPVRWDPDDPVERAVHHVLGLDAVPAPAREIDGATRSTVRAGLVDRGRLAADEGLLGDVFGLLTHAHYRTTPSDLHRILDAPNLAVHALWHGDRVVAVALVAREGGLPADLGRGVAYGGARLRGHALPETLLCHAGRVEAAGLRMLRSVRIATHPAVRRRGLATALVEHVHGAYEVDLFGTLFGAAPSVIGFRRRLGYEMVRVGASRGARTGEPTAVMIRPCTPAASALVATLRAELARELPRQLQVLQAEGWPPSARLAEALGADLQPLTPWTDAELAAIVAQFARGPRPYEASGAALCAWVTGPGGTGHRAWEALEGDARQLLRWRLIEVHAWVDIARMAGLPSVPATMRAVKRAVRAVLDAAPEPS